MLLALLSSAALAGPWIREPGSSYAKAAVGSFSGAEATETTTGGGQLAPLAYQDLSLSLYGELGLPWGLQVTGYLPYVLARNDDEQAGYVSYSGGDAELGLSRRLLASPVALALGAVAKIPTYGDRADLRAEGFGAYATRFPEPGDGQVDLDLRLELGASIPSGRWGAWAQGWVGYRHRLGEFVDGVPWSAQLGAAPTGASGEKIGWAGVEASGVRNLSPDVNTRTWTRIGAFGALNLRHGLAVEAWGGLIPLATASRTGGGGGLGLSWTR